MIKLSKRQSKQSFITEHNIILLRFYRYGKFETLFNVCEYLSQYQIQKV
jgi:hypothetical protein